MDFLPREIRDYAIDHTEPESDVYRRLTEKTYHGEQMPEMLSGPLVGNFLQILVRLTGAQRALDIGMFTGYSALKLAEALPPDGKVFTCEIDRERVRRAREFFQRVPWGNRIKILEGPALESVRALEPPFEIIFIDADKQAYLDYYRRAVELLTPGGVVVLDNALYSGRVLNPENESSRAIAETNEYILQDPRVFSLLMPIRDGLMVAHKRQP